MSGSVNRAILIGNLGQDPDVKTFQDGGKVANLSLATSKKWKDKSSGERREATTWHRVVVRDTRLIGVVERYVVKGTKLYVEGEIDHRKWKDRVSGEDRYITEIVIPAFGGVLTILSGGKSDRRADGPNDGYAPREAARTDQKGNPTWDEGSEEIPF